MRVRHLLGMIIALGVVAAANLTAGVLVLLGAHAGGDRLNGVRGWALIGVGVAIAGAGVWLILGVTVGPRRRRNALRARARPGLPPPISAWGMGDDGDSDGTAIAVGDHSRGGGTPRPVGFSVSHLDVPVLIIGLLLWTALFLIFFSPHCAAGATTC
jgi:hypothetical protein